MPDFERFSLSGPRPKLLRKYQPIYSRWIVLWAELHDNGFVYGCLWELQFSALRLRALLLILRFVPRRSSKVLATKFCDLRSCFARFHRYMGNRQKCSWF